MDMLVLDTSARYRERVAAGRRARLRSRRRIALLAAGVGLAASLLAVLPGASASTSVWFPADPGSLTGIEDTALWQHDPDAGRGGDESITVDLEENGADSETQGLIRFPDIVGTNPGQIPPGSTIVSASLQVYVSDPSAAPISLHPMLIGWDESDTWTSLGAGVQADGVEAAVAAGVVFPTGGLTGQRTIGGLGGSVQAWVDGTAVNHGWVILIADPDGWDFLSSEYAGTDERPRLLVEFAANAAPLFDQDLPDRTDAEGALISLSAAATDPEGAGVTYSATGLPEGLSIDPATGVISGGISYGAAAGSPYPVAVRAEDGFGEFSVDLFAWTVTETAMPIDMAKTSDVAGRAQPGDPVAYTVTVTNPQVVPMSSLSITDPVPVGAAYLAGSASFSMVDAARDSFESGGYGGDDGTVPWSGPWVELDGAAPDPTFDGVTASPSCSGGSCLFVRPDFASGTEGMERGVDLAGASSATLTYRWARTSGGGQVAVRVRGNGLPWTTMATYTLSTDDPVPADASFDISAFAGADTMIRVVSVVAGNGRIYLDDVAIVTGILTGPAGPPPSMVAGVTLAPGEVLTLTYSVVVDDPSHGSGTLSNTASVTAAEEPAGVSATIVDPVNRYPGFDQDLLDREDGEGSVVSLAADATDPDGDLLVWAALGLPDGLSIDPATGEISGTIAFGGAALSPYPVTISVEDVDGLAAIDTFTWTVTATNRAPAVVNPGDRSNSEADPVAFAVNGSDPDGDPLTWSAAGLPDGLSIDPGTGVISGTLTYFSSGVHSVTLRVTDPGLLFDEIEFTWTVANVNRGPSVGHPGHQTVAEGDAVSILVTATDPDGDGVTWSATGLPPGLTIDPISGLLSGTVGFSAADGSPHHSIITATDDGSPQASGAALVDWTVADTNRAPDIANPGDQAAAEGEAVVLPIAGSDPDGDDLAWSATGLPPGLSIDPGSGTISGIVDYAAAAGSPHSVVVTAADDGTPVMTGEASFSWTVDDVNRNPSVTGPGDQDDAEGGAVSLVVVGSDPDGDTLTWTAGGLPPGLAIDPASGEIAGTLTYASDGTYPVVVRATDAGAGSLFDEVAFTWSVTDTNRPPLVTDPGGQTTREGDMVDLMVHASDPDGDGITWSAAGLPPGLSIGPGTGIISGDVTFAASGGSPYSVTITVTDDGDPVESGSVGFEWVITDTNRAPTVDDPGIQSSRTGEAVSMTMSATDPDGDGFTWSASGLPTGLSMEAGSGVISGTVTAPASTVFTVKVSAADDGTPVAVGEVQFEWVVSDDLTITKASAAGGSAAMGETVAYTVTVENPGPATHTGVTVADPLPAGTSWVSTSVTYPVDGAIGTVGDGWETYSYTGSNGTVPWSGPWVETNDDGSSWGGRIHLHFHDGVWLLEMEQGEKWITRTADLSGYASAEVSYRFRRHGLRDSGDVIVVEISPNGVVWTEIARHAGPGDDAWQVKAPIDITDYLSATTSIRFRSLATHDGGELRVDWVEISATQRVTATGPGGPPPNLVSGVTLLPGEMMTVEVVVQVDDPLDRAIVSIDNTATVTSDQQVLDTGDSTSDAVNHGPLFDQDRGSRSDPENAVISLSNPATDPNGDLLTWSAVGLPDGLSIDPSTGVISGTIGYEEAAASPFEVTLRVGDPSGVFDLDSFTWTVTNTNRAPVVAPPADQGNAEGDAVSLAMAGSDPDGNTLAWSATGLPGGLSIDPGSGVISGVVSFDASPSSPFTVTVRAVDDGAPQLSGTVVFSWAVADTNRPPVLVNPGARANGESDVVSLPIPASDPDLDTLTWSATGLPPGLAIDSDSGLITGTVSFDAAAASPYAVTVTVEDDRAPTLADHVTFSWLVANTNRAPIVTPISDRLSDEGEHITLPVVGFDPDGDGITWSATGLPNGLGIDPATGVVTGDITHLAADSSPFTVMVTATDNGTPALWTTLVFGWVVDDVNRAPVLARPADRVSEEGDAVTLAVAASDPDQDTLTWSAAGLPAGLAIDPATGIIRGTITYAASPASPYSVTVTVTDDRVPHLSDEAVFSWTVDDTNRAPVVTDPGDQFGTEGGTVALAVAGRDPDDDSLEWSATGLPPGLAINPSSGVISGVTPTSGVFSVTVAASDDGTPSLSASVGFVWTVAAAQPIAPVIEQLPNRSDLVGDSVVIRPVASSPDGEALVWSASGLPPGITIDPGTGEVSGTLTAEGVYGVGVTVTDRRDLVATAGFIWTVGAGSPEDEPPRAEDDVFAVIETGLEDGVVRLRVLDNDHDPEGTDLRITWLGDVPVGEATIEGGTVIAYRPQVDWLGTTEFSYVVADAAGNTDSATVTVTILPDLEQRAAGAALLWQTPEESRPTSVIGTIRAPQAQLVYGSILQSLHVLRMPLTLLGGAVIWSLLLGGAFNLTLLLRGGAPFLSRRARMHLAVVMARHGQWVPAHVDPGEGEVIHRFVATAKGIVGTGRIHSADGVEWAEVDSPGGRGWVEAIHLTEHVDADTFAHDPIPERMLEGFVAALRTRADLSPFISRYGLWVSHHDDPIHYPPEAIEGLGTSAERRVWKGRNPAYPDVSGSFGDVVAVGIVEAWDQSGRVVEVDGPLVPSTIIPIEYTNFHVLSIGARLTGRARLDQTAWLAHFSYEGNTPYLIALTREG